MKTIYTYEEREARAQEAIRRADDLWDRADTAWRLGNKDLVREFSRKAQMEMECAAFWRLE